MKYLVSCGLALIALGLAAVDPANAAKSGAPANTPPVHFDPDGPLLRHISEYRLFADNARQIPNDGVVPYDINTPLFSDYATKHRFIYVPPGKAIRYREREAFEFPVGSIIVKTFGFMNDMRDPAQGEREIETRLLVRKKDGWLGLPYVWRDDMSDADLKVAGGTVDVEWIHTDGSKRTNNYIVPNMNQCKGCHNATGDFLSPLGPKARHLNKVYPYRDGAENQLKHWTDIGYLKGAPDPARAPKIAQADNPDSGTLDERARAYLDINCGHCHNPKGPASTTGLFLFHDVRDPVKWGVYKTPVAAGRAGKFRFDIAPGHADRSIMIYRLESTDPGIMMPELPRRLVDEEATALLREWIDAMPEDLGGKPVAGD